MQDSFSAVACIQFGWKKFEQRPAAYVLTAFVLIVVFGLAQLVATRLRGVGVALGIVLGPWLWICNLSVALRGARGEEPTLQDAFRPFTERQGDYLMVALAAGIGAVLCGIGVVVTQFLCAFAGVLALQGRDFKAAVIESKDLVLKYPAEVAMLTILSVALNLVGFLLCGLGALVTLPVTALALVRAYEILKSPALLAAATVPEDPPASGV